MVSISAIHAGMEEIRKRRTPESTGKKGDHLVGDYYVSFDKHYKAELAELMEKGMTKEEDGSCFSVDAGSPRNAGEMEAGDRKYVPVGDDEQLGVCRI